MHWKAAGLSALLILSCSAFATAGPVVDAATKAEGLAAEGKTVEALDALNEAVDMVWSEGGLAFRTVALADSVGSNGLYEARADSTFKPDEKLTVYVEPVGYANTSGNVGFTTDLTIENGTGQTLTETEGLFSVSVPFAKGRHEFDMALSFKVPYLRPGDYKATFTVHDQNSDKTGSFEVPFSVALPTAE